MRKLCACVTHWKGCMTELAPYFQLLEGFNHQNIIALDRAHNMFLVGSILSKKPAEILELGIGTGYLTASLIYATAYNRKGKITSVDSWYDWGGKEPAGIDQFRNAGVNVICMGEKEFVHQAPSDHWDVLISDADHWNSQDWLSEHLRIVKDGGFLFFHDTNQPAYFPGLTTIEQKLKDRGIFCLHFRENSRPDERCDRGWLFAVNQKRGT
jgi:predicted O-methyltransferase YrrM